MKKLIVTLLAILIPSLALASIDTTIKKITQMEEDQHVYIKVKVQNEHLQLDGKYKWAIDTPILSGIDLDNYLLNKDEQILRDIFMKLYPRADYRQKKGATNLEKIKAWIDNGCINPDGQVIEKQKFKYKHPKEIDSIDAINAATTLDELKQALIKYLED